MLGLSRPGLGFEANFSDLDLGLSCFVSV